MAIGDDDAGRTGTAGVHRNSGGNNPFGYIGRDWRGVSCPFCGEPMESQYPGQTGPAFYGCPRGCNNLSGGVTEKTISVVRQELNPIRLSWRERASLKERI